MTTFNSVADPVYASADGKAILCTVEIEGHKGPVGYIAADGDADSQALYVALKEGRFGAVGDYVEPPPRQRKKPAESPPEGET